MHPNLSYFETKMIFYGEGPGLFTTTHPFDTYGVSPPQDVIIRFDRIHERDGGTDRQTDTETPHDG